MAEWSINQTDAGYIRLKPEVASIELKTARPNNDPPLQLGIWNSALFERLRRLQKSDSCTSDLMPIPSLAISGHRWELYYTYVNASEGTEKMVSSLRSVSLVLGLIQTGHARASGFWVDSGRCGNLPYYC